MVNASFLGAALGRLVARQTGLRSVHVAAEVPSVLVRAVVESANEARSSDTYAFVVSNQAGDGDAFTAQQAIRFRQGDKLAVVRAGTADLASFDSVFRVAVAETFPFPKAQHPGLADVAGEAGSLVAREIDLDETQVGTLAEFVGAVVETLFQLHEGDAEAPLPWNVAWMVHFDSGLGVLALRIREVMRTEPGLTLGELLQRDGDGCFGLPRGTVATAGRLKRKALQDAVQAYWSDADSARSALAAIGASRGAAVGDEAVWSQRCEDLARRWAAKGDVLLALQEWAEQGGGQELLRELTVGEFLEPVAEDADPAVITVRTAEGRELPLVGSDERGSYLLQMPDFSDLEGDLEAGPQVQVVLPRAAEFGQAVRLVVKAPNVLWEKTAQEVLGDDVILFGTLNVKEKALSAGEPNKLGVKFTVETSAGVLRSWEPRQAWILPAGGRPGVAIIPLGAGQKAMKPEWVVVPEDGTGEAVTERYEVSKPADSVAVLVAGDEHPPTCDQGVEFEPLGDTWWMGKVDTRSAMSIAAVAGGAEVSVTLVPSTKGGAEQSPLVAAATGRARDSEGPGRSIRESLRWKVEQVMGQEVLDGVGSLCGRIALAKDQSSSLEELTSPAGAYSWDQSEQCWEGRRAVSPDPAFVEGEEVRAFRAAYDALGLGELGLSPEDPISRISLAPLALDYPDRLVELLRAYTRMATRSREFNEATHFWAVYPFSLSAWRTDNTLSPEAVLLSPFHPVRLAWVASVEAAFLEAPAGRQREYLAGTVAGWDLPLVGPADVSMGWMGAVATDPGPDQLFVGWAALARASADGFGPLQLPVKAGRYYLPGSSSTGLTASAVDAAVSDYTHMHPQVTTLTIDLPANAVTPRSVEVDAAVVSAASRWLGTHGTEEGGVRVLDSNLRQGPIPRDEIATTFRNLAGGAFSWERYKNTRSGATQPSNLRILQDSGITMQFRSSQAENSGHLGKIPFRRYWVEEGPTTSHRHPALTTTAASTPFGAALSALEQGHKCPQIDIEVDPGDLVGADADWVVTGEAFLAPTEVDGFLRGHGRTRDAVLWEWRPPLLSAEGTSVVGRRPFVTIARVPQSFKDRLTELTRHISTSPQQSDWGGEIVQTLGAQGVGLSSLLGVGGNHAVGAIGFYLAFSYLDTVAEPDAFDVVLPIDACAEFLRALTGRQVEELNSRRADLLGLRFEDGGLTLVPIEIKMYRFLNTGHNLPDVGSSALDEALDQLTVTSQLLEALVEESLDASPLWWNGLASLVEAGFRLRTGSLRAGLAAEFQNLVEGRLEVRAGTPLVFYFQGQPSADGVAYRAFEDRGALVFTADARTARAVLEQDVAERGQAASVPAFAELVHASWSARRDGASAARGRLSEALTEPSPSPEGAAQGSEDLTAVVPEGAAGTPFRGNGEGDAHRPEASARGGATRFTFVASPVPGEGAGADEAPEAVDDVPDGVTADVAEVQAPDPGDAGLRREGTKLHLGDTVNTLAKAPVHFWPGNTALSQMNVGVVGDLGTGKTQFLKTLIHELRWKTREVQGWPATFLIFDYKKDYQQEDFLEAVGGVVLEPSAIPLNVLEPEEQTATAAYQQARKFVDVLEKIYSGIGPKQRSRVTKLVREWFVEHGEAPLVSDLLQAYEAEAVDSVTSILETFVYTGVFEEDRERLKSFEDLMDGSVVVVALDKLGTDSDAKNALVALFLNLYYEYMLRSTKWPFEGHDPQLRTINSFLLVDEAHNIMNYEFPIVESLLLQGREFGFGVVLASQYLNHFNQRNTNYGEPLRSWFIHRVPHVREQELRKLGIVEEASAETADRISSLENHQSFVSTFGVDGRVMQDRPFYALEKRTFDEGMN